MKFSTNIVQRTKEDIETQRYKTASKSYDQKLKSSNLKFFLCFFVWIVNCVWSFWMRWFFDNLEVTLRILCNMFWSSVKFKFVSEKSWRPKSKIYMVRSKLKSKFLYAGENDEVIWKIIKKKYSHHFSAPKFIEMSFNQLCFWQRNID